MLVARAGEHPGVLVKGIDPTLVGKILDLPRHMVAGSVADLAAASTASASPKPPGILLGRELARKLKAGVGDQVRVIAPLASLDSSDWSAGTRTPRFRDFRVAGIFYSGFDEYDRRLVYIELSQAQSFFEQGDVVTGVEIALHDADRSAEVVAELSKRLGGSPYRIFDWRELNHNLFTALKLQKLVLGIALTLIVIVAAFNIVSALTMMVIGKTKEIAILKSMGARGTAGIFLCAGLIIGTVGTVLGVGLGALLCLVIQHYGYPLDPRVYLIDKLPVQVRAAELALTALITLAICVASTLYPSLRAARLRPSEGLRYE
jgi:lipoprotein-releasing system permease protein